jgi:hypothetical protein
LWNPEICSMFKRVWHLFISWARWNQSGP